MIGQLFGKLFGTDKAISSVVENTSNAIDKLFYTAEEKAEDKAKAATEARSMVIDWLRASQGQNLARRLIALVITCVWVVQYLAMMGLSVTAVWMDSPEKFTESARVIGNYAESMNGPMMLILAFYFSAPYMGDFAKGALAKFGKTPT